MIDFNRPIGADHYNVIIESELMGNLKLVGNNWLLQINERYEYFIDSDELLEISEKLIELNRR